MSDRVCRYCRNNSGGRNLGVRVDGVNILIEASEETQARADRLAEMIAALGPEDPPVVTVMPPAVATPKDETKKPDRNFAVGEMVWCNVHGKDEGWHKVTEVGKDYNRGRIKIEGKRYWCPIYNFDRTPRH